MTAPVIVVENLGKRYRIGVAQKRAQNLREALKRLPLAPFRYLQTRLRGPSEAEILWALKDVSFEVNRGDMLGIIGRNGAGKSTLLKILSRITDPTEGCALIHGRVNSLLEVGTGFHAELSGRENIFMNAAMHGMKRREIVAKMDEIIAFAEVEKFIDTPVKFYSSGMYVRLAFAVAAHLEPDILIVDEVLAVGDAEFQQKCMGKMGEVAKGGRTVLFVSHNMPAVTRLCSRCVLLDQGHLCIDGGVHDVVKHYLKADHGSTAIREWPDIRTAPGGEVARLRAVRVCTADDSVVEVVDIRKDFAIEIEYDVLQEGWLMSPNLHCFNEDGIHVFAAGDHDADRCYQPHHLGCYRSRAWIPGNFMAEGTFIITVALSTVSPAINHFYEEDAVAFRIVDSMAGDSARGRYAGRVPGVVRPKLKWTEISVPAEET